MDKLSDLPIKNDTVKSDEESELINKLFPPSQINSGKNASSIGVPPSPPGLPTKPPEVIDNSYKNSFYNKTGKINWKLIGLTSLLFVVLANPWIDSLFCKLPYCGDSSMYLLMLKVFIFIIIIITISVLV
jgi:hypothetical protein